MYMKQALLQADKALAHGDVPIGAVLVKGNEVIAIAGNEVELTRDPTAHAEMLVIRKASAILGNPRLEGCDLYVTLEPCPMCAQAISLARIRRLYYGAYDPKGGGVDHGPQIFEQSTCNHKPEVFGGIEETACAEMLKTFFREKRGE